MEHAFDQSLLFRRWIHAHEEDTPGATVYRPADYSLPPSRGRKGFELRPDGTVTRLSPGPTDRTQQETGTWRFIDGSSIEIRLPSSPLQQVLRIDSVGPDRLVVSTRDR